MRRSAWGAMGWEEGVVSPSGSGRLVFRVIVGYEGDDVVGAELVAAVQVAELYEEGNAGNCAAGVLDELAHSASRAACGEQVVCDEDAGALGDRVGVGLQGVGAVLEFVGGRDRLSRELVRLAREDQALFGAVGEGCAEDEGAGFGREYAVVGDTVGGLGEGVHGQMQGASVLYKRGYVLKGDAWPREIGYG